MELSFENTVLKYFPQLTDNQKSQFLQLKKLYEDWNDKINVVSRKDINALYLHHVLHSMSIANFIDFSEGTRILDLGTGGGFPGIPLAILFPECNFLLIDGKAKKIKVVNEVIEALGLENSLARHKRSEELKMTFDFVLA
ncbi:MAG: 16S rRNA (guanine(527)-N(7))-methyltransferase RsmG, partial [Saprospiraceae bacterium]|nr:16S rRNA (guanine(527)-N(7))-methyltransferase RsmG [Saprospiraceae bacterium]